MDVFQGGIALKPSSLGSSQWEKLENLQQILYDLDRSGLSHLIIDSERAEDDIPPKAFSKLLETVDDGGVRPVLTLPVRRCDFGVRLESVLELISSFDGCGICLVAGNPAYLNPDERGRRAGRPLVEAAVRIRERSESVLLLVGTEHLEGPAIIAARKAGAIPFTLLNPDIYDELSRLKHLTGLQPAVYTPFYIGQDLGGNVWRVLAGYVGRRGYSHDRLAEGLDKLTLVGELDRICGRIKSLIDGGAGLVVGFPALPDKRQIKLFTRALEDSTL